MLKKHVITLGVILTFAFGFAIMAPVAHAGGSNVNHFGLNYSSTTGLGTNDVRQTVSDIIRIALGLLGIVALVIVLISGFEMMTAGGNEEKANTAKKRLVSGIIGLVIIMSAYGLTGFLLERISTSTGANVADQ
jgi:uncharacterized membrane protein